LLEAAYIRAENIVECFEDIKEGILALNEVQKALYCVNSYDMEVQNGGLDSSFLIQAVLWLHILAKVLAA